MGLLDGEFAGVNQIIGATHKYPLELYERGMANHWRPKEVDHSSDKLEWFSGEITDQQKQIVKRALGFFSAGESEVNNNVFLSEYKFIRDGSCRQYLVRKAQEEAIHNETVALCCEMFGLDEKEVAEAYLNIPSVKKKSDFLLRNTGDILNDPLFNVDSVENKRKFVKNLFVFYIICEGTFFWSSFVMILSIYKQGKLKGLGTQIRFTLADETNHLNFGIWLINQLKEEYPDIWTKEFQNELIELLKEAVQLEIEYAQDCMPEPMLGFNADMFVDFMKFIGNRRLESVGLDYKFDKDYNPFPWVEEVVEAKVMTAFFEQRETEYQTSGKLADDF